MINLIPKAEKKKNIASFYYKLLILFLLVMGFSALVASMAILPAYFVSSVKNKIVDTKLEIQKKEPVPLLDRQTLTVIKDINGKLNLIETASRNKFVVSQKVIDAILFQKTSKIKISDIFYENNSSDKLSSKKKISIQGIAPSREVLLSFRRALENSPAFKQVDLPISNFVKGSNIQFYLSLIPS